MPACCELLLSPFKLTLWLQSLTSSWAPLRMMGDAGMEGRPLCFGPWGPSISAKRDQGIALSIEMGAGSGSSPQQPGDVGS